MAEIKTETKRNLDDMIFIIRNQRVMIDRDLAKLYGVPTYRLNEAVKRHINRFPLDFMFRITKQELDELIADCDEFASLKHSSSYPFAFTEHGVAMLASVLNTDKAIEINIEIIRAFVRLRKYVNALNEGNNIDELKKMLLLHIENCDRKFSDHESTIKDIINALNGLLKIESKESRQIGFTDNPSEREA